MSGDAPEDHDAGPSASRHYALGACLCLVSMLLSAKIAHACALGLGFDGAATPVRLAVLLIGLAAAAPALALLTPLLHQRSVFFLLSPNRRFSARNLGAGAGAAALLALLTVALGVAADAFFWAAWPPPAIIAFFIPLIALQATAEELLFRGYLLHASAPLRRYGSIALAAPSVLLFSLLHYTPGGGWAPLAAPFIFAIGATAITLRSGGLSAAIGFHVIYNWFALLVLGGDGPAPGLGPLSWRNEAPPLALALTGIGLLAVALAALWRLIRPEGARR
ncbi:MAG: CPBP family intramembrane metalloprotease [Neomegalonema sp.]|nr:CPBP family intramembrane metalloprotease [Neomegalonema sp.]